MKVGLCNLGCKVNTYEMEYIASLFKERGYEICDFNDFCDVYVVNTCTVTNNSDVKALLEQGYSFSEMWLLFSQNRYNYDTNFKEVSDYALSKKYN